jgi:starvation-inducible DNA-binding protein
LRESHPLARRDSDYGDDGTDDLIVSGVIRLNELQNWFASEHLAGRTSKTQNSSDPA